MIVDLKLVIYPSRCWLTGWNNNNIDDFGDNNRKRPKDRRKNKNKNQIAPSLPPEAIGSLAPGQNPPVQGPTWGTNVGAINDEEAKSMSKKRQFGYAIMACAVVALAVLMVSSIRMDSSGQKI